MGGREGLAREVVKVKCKLTPTNLNSNFSQQLEICRPNLFLAITDIARFNNTASSVTGLGNAASPSGRSYASNHLNATEIHHLLHDRIARVVSLIGDDPGCPRDVHHLGKLI